MPYNADFEIPTGLCIHRSISEAPKGSLFLGLAGLSGLIGWRPGPAGTNPSSVAIEWTCYEVRDVPPFPDESELGLIFEDPIFRVQPNTAYDLADQGARSAGDLVTNGDIIAMIAGPRSRELVYNLRGGTSNAPFMAYKGWRMFVGDQHIFTKLP